jgi:cell division septum initiation protein DivIVA
VYSIVDASGFELSSEFGARRITELRPDVLAQVRECSQMYASFRRSRAENISDIESQLRHMNRKGLKPQKHSLGRSS